MPVDNNVSINPSESAHVDTASVQQETGAAVAKEKPAQPSTEQFAAMPDKKPPRPMAQDHTGIRMNASFAALDAHKQNKSGKDKAETLPGSTPHVANGEHRLGGNLSGLSGGANAMEMQQMAAGMAREQINLSLFQADLEFQKQLAGMVAKMSEPIR